MARYYFSIREGNRYAPDDHGSEFDSLDAAEYEAARTAAEIGRDRLPRSDDREIIVELCNEHRQRVLTVAVRMEIERVEPPPLPPDAAT